MDHSDQNSPNPTTSTTQSSFECPTFDNAGKMETNTSRVGLGNHKTHFFANTEAMAVARKIYLKAFIGGAFLVVLTIFVVFPMFWGSLWKVPDHPLEGWIVDFDGGEVAEFFTHKVRASSNKAIAWTSRSASDFPSIESLERDIVEERAWIAITINPNVSLSLNSALRNPDPSYDGNAAITVYVNEARNENAYRSLISPTVSKTLEELSRQFAISFAQRVSSSGQSLPLSDLLSMSPQVLVSPASYTWVNLRPFDEPVASAATLVGLIYLLILSFFIVAICDGARNASGVTQLLSYGSIVRLRLTSSVMAYFFLSLFYSLVSLAFQIDFTRQFGRAGFVTFWMVNWAGMMAVGLALESLVTIMTTRFVPFFMIFWIISNVSVCVYPIETLPRIFRYGYAAPFYNVSKAFRTIAFNTKNQLGLNFGVLIIWIIISCITLSVFQWIVWRGNEDSAVTS